MCIAYFCCALVYLCIIVEDDMCATLLSCRFKEIRCPLSRMRWWRASYNVMGSSSMEKNTLSAKKRGRWDIDRKILLDSIRTGLGYGVVILDRAAGNTDGADDVTLCVLDQDAAGE